jgi:outer membrane biosynthesis protein TonB
MGLDVAAAQAVAQWRFTPATLNGRPLKVIYTLTVNFTVQ